MVLVLPSLLNVYPLPSASTLDVETEGAKHLTTNHVIKGPHKQQ